MHTILVVDGDVALLRLYEIALRAEGYHVLTASSVKGAMENLRRNRPNIVVMDIDMPGMDGTTETLGNMVSRAKDISIILNTHDSSMNGNSRSWAPDDWVVKSLDLTDLRQAIERVIQFRFFDR
jgi:DNA-binding NtrC family response regulator